MMRIVLTHSGGFDLSIAIPRLADRHSAEIIALTLDLGQVQPEHARSASAWKCHMTHE
jgi:argininosuccinate synthase